MDIMMITFLIVSFCERSLQLILNHDISNLKGVKLGHKKKLFDTFLQMSLWKKVTHYFMVWGFEYKIPTQTLCIMWKRFFFSKPTKNVLLCYTNFLTPFAREKNNPSPPPVKKITYGYLEVTLLSLFMMWQILCCLIWKKNMDLRIRLFFVNLRNIWKEIIYISTLESKFKITQSPNS